MWSIYYPNVMLEWYPYSLVVSTLVPRSPDHTTNILEFYYPEEIALFERGLVEAHQAAYMESAAEDAQICTQLHRGRKALHALGRGGPRPVPLAARGRDGPLPRVPQAGAGRIARRAAGT